MKRSILAGLALAVIPVAVLGTAEPAAACSSFKQTSYTKPVKMTPGSSAKGYVRLYFMRCGNEVISTGARVGYTDPDDGAIFCGRIDKITMDVRAYMGSNPPPQEIACSRSGASAYINLPDRIVDKGDDRCTLGHMKVVIVGATDGAGDTLSVCVPTS